MKKVYIIAALVVLLGATLLPAMAYPTIREFPKPFVNDEGTIDYDFDGMPDIAIILGSKAAPEDVLGATLIAAKIASHLYYKNAMWVDAKHAAASNITLYHGSFTAMAYGKRYQALDLVRKQGEYDEDEDTNDFWSFLWSWNWATTSGGWNPDPFDKIYPLHGNYVFVPSGVKSDKNPTVIKYSIGLKVDPDELKEWVVFAGPDSYYPPAYTDLEKAEYAVHLTFDCPGTFTFSYDAWDTTKDYNPVQGPITYTWAHGGFYFIHPLNPIDVKRGTEITLPWMGYKLVAERVEVDEPGTYSVGFVVYKIGTSTPVDYFHIENSLTSGDAGVPLDNDPTTFQKFLYSMIHRDIYILADINGDDEVSSSERLVPYFGITVRDVDEVLQTVTMDFYSLILAPNIYPGSGNTTGSGDRAYDWNNTKWFFDDTYGWPHPAGSDYVDAASEEGSMNVDVILEMSTYPDTTSPRIFAGGNMGLVYDPGSDVANAHSHFFEAKGYIVDEQTVFGPWFEDLAEDEKFLGISGYYKSEDSTKVYWYMVVKSGTLGATIFTNETGWYKPANEDGHLVVGGKDYWFTSVVSKRIVAGQECPALPPEVSGKYCGPGCGPTWGLYKFEEKDEILKKYECDAFAKPDTLFGKTSDQNETCGKYLEYTKYADWEDEDVTLAVYHWQYNWLYPINATGVFAGIYDRVEDRNGDGKFTGATELVPVPTPEGGTVFEDVTPDEYKDLYFNFANPEEVFSFIRAPIAYMDDWVFDGETLSEDVVNKNLILVGGPLVNTLVDYLNDTGNLYILYKTDGKTSWLYNPQGAPGERDINLTYAIKLIDPTIDTTYVYKIEGGNGLGVIQYAKANPWNEDKLILVVAGTDRYGTLAASIALADPTKLANTTIQTYYNAGEGDNAPAVIVIGIRPTTVPTRVAVQPVLVVPVGLPSS